MINYSIIIPHYNIPNLLMRCLHSIPQREDIQVIVVDDGSPDANVYKTKYSELSAPNVEFYSVEHQGLAGKMRNIGLTHAKGKWVAFLDADDLLSENANSIFNKNVEYDEDIVYYKSKVVLSDDLSTPSKRVSYNWLFDTYKLVENESLFKYHFQPLWGKMFKKDFISKHKLQCDDTKYSNDVYFSVTAGYYAKKIRIEHDVLYIVTERVGSLASGQMKNTIPSLNECKIRLAVAEKVRKFLEHNGIYDEETQFYGFMSQIRTNYTLYYAIMMLKYLFIHPSYITPFIKRDFTYLYKSLSQK